MSRNHHPNRRALMAGAAASLAAGAAFAQRPKARGESELTWLPAWRLREMIGARQVSPREVMDHYLARTERLNPTIGAFSYVDYDGARAAARAAEQAVMAGAPLGPLHGIPVPFKDHIMVRGMPLAFAARGGRPAAIPEFDDAVTERVRAAGGIPMGKTVMAGPPGMIGAANPWDLRRVAGASSSGSAAAVAAGMAPIAIGSDGGGSTRLPAAYSGLVGLHPTVGRVPSFGGAAGDPVEGMKGFVLRGWSATYGPMARDVRDSAVLMQVLAGPDWRSLDGFKGAPPDYLGNLGAGVSGYRLAWTDDYGYARPYFDPISDRVISAVRSAADSFTKVGARIDRPAFSADDSHPIFRTMMHGVEGAVGAPQGNRGELMPLRDALIARERMARQYLELLDRYDVILSATTPIVAPTREEWEAWLKRPGFGARYTCLTGQFNTLGFPAIAMPAGFVDGMPVSLQIVGRPDEDAKVLRVAQAFEKAFAHPGHAPVAREGEVHFGLGPVKLSAPQRHDHGAGTGLLRFG